MNKINIYELLTLAFGLNCWECDTRDYFECADGDELPSATYRHCDDEFGGPPVCIKVVSHSKWPKSIDWCFDWWILFNRIHFQHLVFVANVLMIFYRPVAFASQLEILITRWIAKFVLTMDVTVRPHLDPLLCWLLCRLCLWNFFAPNLKTIPIIVVTFIHIRH